jgi:putative flippase GtrA
VKRRWESFVAVGAIGFVLQIATLVLLSSGFRWGYAPATALAVELAVLNNFSTILSVGLISVAHFLIADQWVFASRSPTRRTTIPLASRPARTLAARAPAPGVSP